MLLPKLTNFLNPCELVNWVRTEGSIYFKVKLKL